MTPRRAAFAVSALIGSTVAVRLYQTPLDAYGDSAAQYIEHLARLRLLLRIREGLPTNPVEAFVALDGLYPPLLHILTGAFGTVFGHEAEVVVWTGLIWWFGLCLAVSRVAHSIRPSATYWVLASTAALPALHASATRYYYDLPMTTLLWAAVATLMASGNQTPVRAGLRAGLLMSLAALIKWAALPLGFPLLMGSLLSVASHNRDHAVRAGLALTVSSVLVLGGFIWAGSTSFGAMGTATFQPPAGADTAAIAQWRLEGFWGMSTAMLLQLQAFTVERLIFYGERIAATTLSPILALAAVPLIGRWFQARSPAWPLVTTGLLGTGAFVVFLLPPFDDRFLLTVAPVFALSAGIGASYLGERYRQKAAWFCALLAVATAIDMHCRPNSTPLHPGPHPIRDDALDGRSVTWRLGAGSSWDLRGWARSDSARTNRTALRARLDTHLTVCADEQIRRSDGSPISAYGDDNWFAYREALAEVQHRAAGARWTLGTDPDVGLTLSPQPHDAFHQVTPSPQAFRYEIEDPSGGPAVIISADSQTACASPTQLIRQRVR